MLNIHVKTHLAHKILFKQSSNKIKSYIVPHFACESDAHTHRHTHTLQQLLIFNLNAFKVN